VSAGVSPDERFTNRRRKSIRRQGRPIDQVFLDELHGLGISIVRLDVPISKVKLTSGSTGVTSQGGPPHRYEGCRAEVLRLRPLPESRVCPGCSESPLFPPSSVGAPTDSLIRYGSCLPGAGRQALGSAAGEPGKVMFSQRTEIRFDARDSAVKRGRTVPPILFSRNAASYCSRPSLRSQPCPWRRPCRSNASRGTREFKHPRTLHGRHFTFQVLLVPG
jgi:hypothetical protein